jgi:hypothetical protein
MRMGNRNRANAARVLSEMYRSKDGSGESKQQAPSTLPPPKSVREDHEHPDEQSQPLIRE